MDLATAYVAVQLKDTGIAAQAQKAGKAAGTASGAEIEKGLEKGSKQGAAAAVGNISTIGSKIKSAFVLGAAVAGLKNVIDAASDLNEEVSKSKVLFGEANAVAVREFAKGAAAIGQSEKQALAAAGTFAVFGKAAGLAGQDLVDFSIKSDQLASDLSSFFNTSPEQAIQAIGAAFRGESEPIRAYGVLLNEAALKQEALDKGLIQTTTGTLPPAIRVQAAYGLIMKQTSDAQGDFARTADGVANKSRIMKAEFENTKAELGQALLPAFSTLLDIGTKLIQLFNDLPGPIKTATIALIALAALKGPIGGLVSVVKTLGPSLLAVAASAPYLAPLIGIIGAIAIIMQNSGEIVNENTAVYQDFTKAVKDTTRAISASFAQYRTAAVEQDGITESALKLGQTQGDLLKVLGDDSPGAIGNYISAIKEAAGGNEEAGAAADKLQGALADIKWSEYIGGANQLNGAFKTLGIGGIADAARAAGATEEQVARLAFAFKDGITNATVLSQTGIPLAATMDEIRKRVSDLSQAAGGASQEFANMTNANDKANVALQSTQDAFDGAAQAADNFKTALDTLLGVHINLDDATAAAIESEQGLQDAFKKANEGATTGAKTLDIYTQAGRDNRDVIKEGIDAELKYADAFIQSGGSQEEAAQKLLEYKERLVEQAVQSGLSEDAVREYVDQLGLTPEQVTTAIELARLEEEKARLSTWLTDLEGVPKEKQTQIQALIDQGKIAEAEAELAILARQRTVTFGVRVVGGEQVDTVSANFGNGTFSGTRAHGGPVIGGHVYRVNEYAPRQPEFFVPNSDGKVVPLGGLQDGGAAVATGPPTIITNIGTVNGVSDFERRMDERDRRIADLLGAR